MPKSTGKSLLMGLGQAFVKAHNEHKGDETDYGQMNLPPNIENGVAQLTDCKFDVYKKGDMKGKVFFFAQGTVVEPAEVAGVPIVGLYTRIGPEPICDTPKRKTRPKLSDHIAWAYNELRLLGLETDGLSPEEVEAGCAALEESKPYFRFRTWQGSPSKQFPNPRIQHEWNGIIEDYSPNGIEEAAEAGVEEEVTEEETETEETTEEEETTGGDEEESEEATEDTEEGEDLDALAEKAQNNDKKAGNRLTELAIEAGVDKKTVADADDWASVVEMIRDHTANTSDREAESEEEATEEEAEEEPEVVPPKKKQVYNFRPIDPKSKKPAKKAVSVEVVAVDNKKETVDIKNLDTHKIIKGIKWDRLETAD